MAGAPLPAYCRPSTFLQPLHFGKPDPMNTASAIQTTGQAVKRFVRETKAVARREPNRAMTTALLVGLALHILPTRFLVAGASAVTLTLLRPALLTLGAMKALELFLPQTQPNQPHS